MPAAVEEPMEPVAPPKPKTELEAIQMQANQVTDDSLESTRRMLALCEEVSVLWRLFCFVILRKEATTLQCLFV